MASGCQTGQLMRRGGSSARCTWNTTDWNQRRGQLQVFYSGSCLHTGRASVRIGLAFSPLPGALWEDVPNFPLEPFSEHNSPGCEEVPHSLNWCQAVLPALGNVLVSHPVSSLSYPLLKPTTSTTLFLMSAPLTRAAAASSLGPLLSTDLCAQQSRWPF